MKLLLLAITIAVLGLCSCGEQQNEVSGLKGESDVVDWINRPNHQVDALCFGNWIDRDITRERLADDDICNPIRIGYWDENPFHDLKMYGDNNAGMFGIYTGELKRRGNDIRIWTKGRRLSVTIDERKLNVKQEQRESLVPFFLEYKETLISFKTLNKYRNTYFNLQVDFEVSFEIESDISHKGEYSAMIFCGVNVLIKHEGDLESELISFPVQSLDFKTCDDEIKLSVKLMSNDASGLTIENIRKGLFLIP